ncbi:MAG: HU domain-containing protein [Bacteroidales bacterium]|jgi:predicted histone-like DNA-binding protein|nr:HU domain-containing protein [Bacteroidales bacterium]
MAAEYTVVKRKFNDKDGNTQEKFYAMAHVNEIIKTKQVANSIQRSSSLNSADVYGVLCALSEVLATQLRQGNSVKLDGIGTFSLSLTSKPSTNSKNVPHKSVKVSRICFKAERNLSREIRDLSVAKAKTSL